MNCIQRHANSDTLTAIEFGYLPFVPFYLNGKGPYISALDTGYLGFFEPSTDLAANLGLKATDDGLVYVEEITVCGHQIRDITLDTRDVSKISGQDRAFDGFMGMGFLKHFHTVLDYPNSTLSLSLLANYFGIWTGAPSWTSYARFKYANRYLVVPIKIDDSGPFDFLLDTGARQCIVSIPLAESLQLDKGPNLAANGNADAKPYYHSQVKHLCVGKAASTDLSVTIMDCSHVSEAAGHQIDGYLGYNFLKDHCLTINVLELFLGVK